MYTIYLDDGTCIYDTSIQSETCKLISPTLNLSDNDAGELTFTILPSNPGYDLITKFSTTVTVYRDNEWLWAGRVLNENTDFYKQKSVTCEGVLAFLNDTHQESIKYTNITIEAFINNMLSVHNQKVGNDRKIYKGTVTVTDGTKDRYSEYEVTLDALNDLITDNEGHMYISYSSNKYYLNYVADFHNASEQYIEFGKNLLDYTIEANMDNFASVILPLGKEDEETGNRLTVASVNQGSIYVADADSVAAFGWIEKLYDDSEITNPNTLLSNAQKLLAESKIEDITLQISAIDLHVLDNNIQSINLLDRVYVRSSYHGVSDFYPVTELSYNLADPSGDTFTLGKAEARSLTTRSDALNEAIYKKLKQVPDTYDILAEAKRRASALITSCTTGFVTIVPGADGHAQEIVISETEDYLTAQRLWRWNLHGFGYSSTGYNGEYGTAITMRGEIVADFITAGTMSANRIAGGELTSLNGNTEWDLNTGEFTMKKGNIQLSRFYDYGGNDVYRLELTNSGDIISRSSNLKTHLDQGRIYFGQYKSDNTYLQTGYIDGAANIHNITTDKYYKGLNIVAPYRDDDPETGSNESMMRFISDRVSIGASNDSSQTSRNVSYPHNYIKVLNQADGLVYTLHFINGWLVTGVSNTEPN